MLRNARHGYGSIAILFHWLIALLIVGQLAAGIWMTRSGTDPTLQFSLYQWHKSFGMLVLALCLLRPLWALADTRPGAVDTMSALEKRAARLAHYALFILPILAALSGWAVASSSPLGIPTFAFNLVVVPHLPLPRSEAAEAWWSEVHAWLVYIVAFIAFWHSMAALRHHFWLRDRVLKRMLRPVSR